MESNVVQKQTPQNVAPILLKFIFCSAIGIFMFFIPVTYGGRSTIPLDHIVTAIRNGLPALARIYALIVIVLGGLWPFYKRTWNKDTVTTVFSILKFTGIIVAFMAYFKYGPKSLFEADMIPFLFNSLVIPVGLIVPIGSVFLAFIVGYGLIEFIGVMVRPIMRPVWKTPGRSAVDAVASFVGSYSIGLLITNKVYKEGTYTAKEAAIIATGFSTVSATFMIIVAKTLGLMDNWNLFFFTTLIVTFLVTAITARIKPLSSKSDSYYADKGNPEPEYPANLRNAYSEALKAAGNSLPLSKNITDNLRDGFLMAMGILPSILSVGLIGLVLAKFTPVFDILGYVFYPFTLMLQIPEPMLAAKASGLEIAEMFLPAVLVAKTAIITKFVIGVVSISSILFFSASIPCILSTEIPLSVTEIVIIWIERTILTLLITAPVAHFFF